MIPVLPLLSVAGSAVGKILRAVPWQAYALAAAVAACWWYGEARADQREAEVRAEYELRLTKEAEQSLQLFAELEADHRRRESALSDQIIQADARHAQDLKDVEARTGRDVDRLRSGEQRVRKLWQACIGKLPAPGATADTGPGDAGPADDGNASAGRILRIAGECDAAVKRWQTTWNAAVKTVNAPASGGDR